MFRKMITMILAVAILSVVPAMLAGCDHNVRTQTTVTEEKNHVAGQDTVVE
jgi:hypothetical protein